LKKDEVRQSNQQVLGFIQTSTKANEYNMKDTTVIALRSKDKKKSSGSDLDLKLHNRVKLS